jgi:SulP family sulfate permease
LAIGPRAARAARRQARRDPLSTVPTARRPRLRLPSRADLPHDLLAGFTLGVTQIGLALAYTIVAGVPPVHGLYATMTGTPVGALTAGTQRMAMVTTAALSLTVGASLAHLPEGQKVPGLVVLTLLTGLMMLAAGLLRGGGLTRFISNAVMVGFMTGVAVQIVLSQLGAFTGFSSGYENKVVKAGDLVAHAGRVDPATLALGLATVAVVLVVGRTKAKLFAMAVALVAGTALALLPALSGVATIGDIAPVAAGFPTPQVPDLSLVPELLVPALSLTIIGLVQGAGISRSVRNRDGHHGDVSRDFSAQGLANVAAGFFGGATVGGSVAATAVNMSAGARTRWAAVFAGVLIVLLVVLAAPLVAAVPQAVTAGIVIVAAMASIKPRTIGEIWAADRVSAGVMAATFALVLVIPLQYAVLAGTAIAVLKYIYLSSVDITVVELDIDDHGRCREGEPPKTLADGSVTVLDIYGSLFFAAGPKVKELLPDPAGARRAVVVLRLRGRGTLHSASLALIRDYAATLAAGGGRLYLAGVGSEMREQLERTGLLQTLGEDAVLSATEQAYGSCRLAEERGQSWLSGDAGGDGKA